MKTLKITLLLALFVTVSSQTSKSPKENIIQKEARTYDSSKPYYDLIAHSKDKIRLPSKS